MKKIKTSIVILVCLTSKIYSQDVLKTDSTDKNTQTVVTFNSGRSTSKKIRENSKDLLTVGTISFLSGYIPFRYERLFSDYFSISIGTGITTRDYFREAFDGSIYEDKINESPLWNSSGLYRDYQDNYSRINGSYNNRVNKIGYMFSLSPRFHTSGDRFDDFIVAPEFSYKYYSIEAMKANTDVVTSEYDPVFLNTIIKENVITKDIVLNLGYQFMRKHIVIEWISGIGIRDMKSYRQDLGYTYTTNKFEEKTRTINNVRFYLPMEINIGYAF